MVLRQQQKDSDSQRRRQDVEDGKRTPADAVKEAWADQSALLTKISKSNRTDVEHLLNFLNFEIMCSDQF